MAVLTPISQFSLMAPMTSSLRVLLGDGTGSRIKIGLVSCCQSCTQGIIRSSPSSACSRRTFHPSFSKGAFHVQIFGSYPWANRDSGTRMFWCP
ncbi:hypothetical protein B0T09DRAFT_47485 [Sordaria sp. MPI-SDFR-AT-0083]|nr:hypothetical protein B0T09DRAFT_47485 [Sordaria sp. MPI-SDFR-AT-0083]